MRRRWKSRGIDRREIGKGDGGRGNIGRIRMIRMQVEDMEQMKKE